MDSSLIDADASDNSVTVAEGLRTLDHHVAILGAPSDLWDVFLLLELFDGTVNGGMNCGMETMIDRIQARKKPI